MTAAAIIIIKERHIVDAFLSTGATTPAQARHPDELNIGHHGVAWAILRRRGVVREASPGSDTYYVDTAMWVRATARRRRVLVIVIFLVVIAAIATAVATKNAVTHVSASTAK